MALHRHREETLNTLLAIILADLGVDAEAETIQAHGQHRPDVAMILRGLRVVIEGKFADQAHAKDQVLAEVQRRVQLGIASLAAAVVYPIPLRQTPTADLKNQLPATILSYCIVSETEETTWFEGTPAAVMDALRRAQETMAQDDLVGRLAQGLMEKLIGVALLWIGQTGTCDRLADILGIPSPQGETVDEAEGRRTTAAKVAALVLANALIFQEQLALTQSRVEPLRKLQTQADVIGAASQHWRWIWENINYISVFQLGERVLAELPASRATVSAFGALLGEAREICAHQAALRHDLMGRIYHWLLHQAKYLGTFYTSVPAATLLLKLALSRAWPQDFGDPAQLAEFKVADLACGTGTLLMAAAQALTDSYILARAKTQRRIGPDDLNGLHQALMETVLHGFDVLPTAVHLTASTLALLAPEIAFTRMNLYVMPMGVDGNTPRLGSLDFLGQDEVWTQITLDESQAEIQQTAAGEAWLTKAVIPPLDLCVMNPPFVRSTGTTNLLFGSLPLARDVLQTELKKRVKSLSANITAGLGSVFVALADQRLKPGGRLAIVLPAALASGEAWGPTRQLLADRYHLEIVVSSHDTERFNFSENTGLSEIMFIARKRQNGEAPEPTAYLNLWRNPTSVFEALDLVERLKTRPEGVIRSLSGSMGEVLTLPAPIGDENWTGALFARSELARVFLALRQGQVIWPGQPAVEITLCLISEIGCLGPDSRRVLEAFDLSRDVSTRHPAFWDHKSELVKTIQQQPNCWLSPRTVPYYSDRTVTSNYAEYPYHLWTMAADVLLAERARTNTHRVLAVGFDEPVLGNTWWTLKTDLSPERRKSLLLWLNSSLSLLSFFGRHVMTQGAWMKMKKSAWSSVSVLDVRTLSNAQATSLAEAYDAICTQELQALAKLKIDPARQAIDDALSTVLGLPDLTPLRAMLAQEPGLTGKSAIVRPVTQQTSLLKETAQPDLF